MKDLKYVKAFNEAVNLARLVKREVGIEKANEFGKTGYRVKLLPNKENRFGWELRCEVVSPDSPLMAE